MRLHWFFAAITNEWKHFVRYKHQNRCIILTFQFPAMIGWRAFNWVDILPWLVAVKALVPARVVARRAMESFMVDWVGVGYCYEKVRANEPTNWRSNPFHVATYFSQLVAKKSSGECCCLLLSSSRPKISLAIPIAWYIAGNIRPPANDNDKKMAAMERKRMVLLLMHIQTASIAGRKQSASLLSSGRLYHRIFIIND